MVSLISEIFRNSTVEPCPKNILLGMGQGVGETLSWSLRSCRQIAFTKDYQDIGVRAPQWQNIARCIETITSLIPLHDVRLTVDLGTIEVYGDPMLEKVFGNLVDNSLRHGEHVSLIRFSCKKSNNNELYIVYEDNRAGVPDADKERIFQKGFGKNTGFGLFLSREILGITGLSIKENGLPEKGAWVEISVPKDEYRFIP